MKYYRCPHCGEPGISAFHKNIHAKTHYNMATASFEDLLKDDKGEVCIYCNKPYVISPRYHWTPFVLLSIAACLAPFVILFLSIFAFHRNAGLAILMILLIPVITLAMSYLLKLPCAPLPADKDTMKKINVMSNVSVELLEIAKNIHNYDIHAIKFDAKTENVRFKEAFTHERVPVMFLKKTRAQVSIVEAYVIKKEFVPDELLFVGSSFSIIDTKGTVIGKGRIHKIFQ
ncbi:MAG: hypothetical protein E7410_06150 [Ruminococcaceae bacterium]|nr:hypothetical protein [Oscillospiraceae bacterium]